MNAESVASVATVEPTDATESTTAHRLDLELGATAVLAILFLVLRLLAVSRWDWPTVTAVADTFDFGDTFAIAFGTIAEQPWLTGVFTALLLPLVLLRILWPLPEHRGQLAFTTLLAALVLVTIAVAMTVTYANPWTLLGAAAFGAVMIAIRVFAHNTCLRQLADMLTGRIALIAGLCVLLLAVLDDTPWTIREQIVTDRAVLTGYVLEESPGFLHVLTDDRDVLIIPTVDVTARTALD